MTAVTRESKERPSEFVQKQGYGLPQRGGFPKTWVVSSEQTLCCRSFCDPHTILCRKIAPIARTARVSAYTPGKKPSSTKSIAVFGLFTENVEEMLRAAIPEFRCGPAPSCCALRCRTLGHPAAESPLLRDPGSSPAVVTAAIAQAFQQGS